MSVGNWKVKFGVRCNWADAIAFYGGNLVSMCHWPSYSVIFLSFLDSLKHLFSMGGKWNIFQCRI